MSTAQQDIMCASQIPSFFSFQSPQTRNTDSILLLLTPATSFLSNPAPAFRHIDNDSSTEAFTLPENVCPTFPKVHVSEQQEQQQQQQQQQEEKKKSQQQQSLFLPWYEETNRGMPISPVSPPHPPVLSTLVHVEVNGRLFVGTLSGMRRFKHSLFATIFSEKNRADWDGGAVMVLGCIHLPLFCYIWDHLHLPGLEALFDERKSPHPDYNDFAWRQELHYFGLLAPLSCVHSHKEATDLWRLFYAEMIKQLKVQSSFTLPRSKGRSETHISIANIPSILGINALNWLSHLSAEPFCEKLNDGVNRLRHVMALIAHSLGSKAATFCIRNKKIVLQNWTDRDSSARGDEAHLIMPDRSNRKEGGGGGGGGEEEEKNSFSSIHSSSLIQTLPPAFSLR